MALPAKLLRHAGLSGKALYELTNLKKAAATFHVAAAFLFMLLD